MKKEKQKNAPTVKQCEWCGKEIKDKAQTQGFLTGVFGYAYCTKRCMSNHINSK